MKGCTIDFSIILNDVIPNNKLDVFNKYLSQLEKLMENKSTDIEYIQYDIEDILGVALFYKNNIIISLTNLFIVEYNIQINKMDVLKSIYSSRCRDNSRKITNGDCVLFASFDDHDISSRYIHEYWNIFETN